LNNPLPSFGRAEAAAVIVLKPLEQALEDGDRIRGVILGTGINSSGSIAPVNAPVASAQENAMRRAFQMAGRSPQDVSFLELHATGTARGDPTEANWAGKAFQRDGDLLIGSVKGNIGYVIVFLNMRLCLDHGQ
jgi:acyl transferase domain-containing protein